MDIAINVILGTGLFVFLSIVLFFMWDNYKEREWRRNNPNEHDIMNRKIKDDFSE